MDSTQVYLKNELRETFRVIETCLSCIYSGQTHMYRALASQLRLLLCDTSRKKDNSLLVSVYPKLEVSSVESISWSEYSSGYFQIRQIGVKTSRVAQMPFEITQFNTGLSIADLLLEKSKLIPIDKWSDQFVTYSPTELTIKDIIRSVADKGGGAHVDSSMSPALKYMRQLTPVDKTYAELFIIAVARFMHFLGEHLFNYKGCRIPDELFLKAQNKYNLGVFAHHEWSDARMDLNRTK